MKYQKSKDNFGYTEYIDNNGYTKKGYKAKLFHTLVKKVDLRTRNILKNFSVILYRNSTTIVSRSFFTQIDEIIKNTIQMWKEVGYPFFEEIYIRTASFNNSNQFSMPDFFFEADNNKKYIEKIQSFLCETQADQILIHPRLSIDSLKNELVAVRAFTTSEEVKAEFGFGGIKNINEIEKARNIIQGSIGKSIDCRYVKKNIYDFGINYYIKLIKILKIIIPYFEKEYFKDYQPHAVYEFHNLNKNKNTYLILNDIESIN